MARRYNMTDFMFDRRKDHGEYKVGRHEDLLLPSVPGHEELQGTDFWVFVTLQAFTLGS